MEEDAGYSVGAFSPSGRRLAVFRLRNDEWRLGLVEIATGRVVWTEVAPDLGLWGRSLQWLKDDALEESANLPAPEVIAADIAADLEAALEQFNTIAEDLK